MDAADVLKDKELTALQAEPGKTLALLVTVRPEDCPISQDLSDGIHNTLALTLAPPWNQLPIYILPAGTKIEALMLPTVEAKPEPVLKTKEIACTRSVLLKGNLLDADAGSILNVFRHVLEDMPLFKIDPVDWELHIVPFYNEQEKALSGWSIALRTAGACVPRLPGRDMSTYLDVNLIKDTFYLLGIGLVQHLRGRGYGTQLYEACEKIAAELGCKYIRQTPSGNAYRPMNENCLTEETRFHWLTRRGWLPDGNEVYKELKPVVFVTTNMSQGSVVCAECRREIKLSEPVLKKAGQPEPFCSNKCQAEWEQRIPY